MEVMRKRVPEPRFFFRDLERQERVHPAAQSEGLGIANTMNLRPERTRSSRIDSASYAASGIADLQPAFSFPTTPGPKDRAMEFWPFGPGATPRIMPSLPIQRLTHTTT
jgi:hypothetical protein